MLGTDIFAGMAGGAGGVIRAAGVGDSPAVAELVTELGYSTSPEQMAERLRVVEEDSNHAAFVFESPGVVSGFLGVNVTLAFEFDRPIARIAALVVAEKARRQGVGEVLVAFAERWAAERGCGTIVVSSGLAREGAHRFYEGLGYGRKGFSFTMSVGR